MLCVHEAWYTVGAQPAFERVSDGDMRKPKGRKVCLGGRGQTTSPPQGKLLKPSPATALRQVLTRKAGPTLKVSEDGAAPS